MSDLATRVCQPCSGETSALDERQIKDLLADVHGWKVTEGYIERTFRFDNYHQTIAFVNAVAWIANKDWHHPLMDVGYRDCTVKYWTHAIDGLSENDFICAAKINALVDKI